MTRPPLRIVSLLAFVLIVATAIAVTLTGWWRAPTDYVLTRANEFGAAYLLVWIVLAYWRAFAGVRPLQESAVLLEFLGPWLDPFFTATTYGGMAFVALRSLRIVVQDASPLGLEVIDQVGLMAVLLGILGWTFWRGARLASETFRPANP